MGTKAYQARKMKHVKLFEKNLEESWFSLNLLKSNFIGLQILATPIHHRLANRYNEL